MIFFSDISFSFIHHFTYTNYFSKENYIDLATYLHQSPHAKTTSLLYTTLHHLHTLIPSLTHTKNYHHKNCTSFSPLLPFSKQIQLKGFKNGNNFNVIYYNSLI